MKKRFLFILCNGLLLFSAAQTGWQQHVAYTIDVSLNDAEKTLDAFENLVYTNNSPDTLRFIWFHLWPNAYKNDRTAFSDQLLQIGNTKFYFADKEQRGYINRLDFKVDAVTAKTEDHPQYIDVIKVLLPKPLPPKGKITITTPFHVKLPFNFSRGGYDGQSFQVTQWYPKPAVYDKSGWHEMPYLDQGEFYSEFGSFEVNITVPKAYIVAATGELQNEEEKAWLKSRGSFSVPPVQKQTRQTINRKNGTTTTKKPVAVKREPILPGTKTLQFRQDSIHDFAWFADKNFIAESDTTRLPSGRVVTVASFYTPAQKELWQKSLRYAKEALRFYSTEVGEYPYNVATVVQGPESFGGGMEYPTITIISPTPSAQSLDATIAHELGHNWFYGILASNERTHPWMDEGLNTFYENKYTEKKYGRQSQWEEWMLQHKAMTKTDQPIETPSEDFSAVNYELVAYHKTGEWLKSVEQKLGADTFRGMMHRYFDEWKFRHPQPADFDRILTATLSNEAAKIVAERTTKGSLPANRFTGTTFTFPLKKGAIKNYLLAPTKNLLLFSPVVGFNVYDKLMVGGLLTNYGSPTTRFNFLAVPLYATGSNSFTGLGKLNYAFFSTGAIRRTDVFFNAATFHSNEYKDSVGNPFRLRFVKLVPGLRFTFREKDPRSTATKFIQWKTFLFNEQSLAISLDSVIRGRDTSIQFRYSTPKKERYLNQLLFAYQNSRALYPFDARLQVEQAQDFVRTTFTSNYFFNYAKGGGLAVRLFAGKFSYLGEKTIQKQFDNDRFYLNLTGPKGFEDYTYSDYFLGRGKFDGLPSQQLIIRDGAFKVRTDQLANKVGKTDNWLAAVNLVSTIPPKINPLSALPFRLPLRVFADIGTYAEAWDRDNDADRFLFDAGLQLSLLRETLNIYVPLLYSKVYSTYFKSTIPSNRFLKTISFSIDLYNKDLKKLNHELEF